MRTAKRDEQLGAVQNRVKEAYTAVFKAETKATACQAELAHGIDAQAQQQAEQAAMAVETQAGILVEAEPVQKTDRYQAGVTRADSGKKLSRNARQQIRVLDGLGKKYNTPIVVEDTITRTGNDGRVYSGADNAYYDPRDGSIHVALDAQQGAYMFFAVHELTHKIESENADAYRLLSDFVLDKLESNELYQSLSQGEGSTLEERIASVQALYEKRGQTLTRDEAIEEIVCDAIPVILSDEQTVLEFVSADRTLAQRVYGFFEKFYEELTKQIANLVYGSSNKAEYAALSNDAQTVREIADLFKAALESTNNSGLFSETVENGDVSYSAKKNYTPRSLADMEKSEYNKYGWATANNVLSKGEQARFLNLIGRKQAGDVFQMFEGKRYAIPVESDNGTDSILVLTDGRFSSPSVDMVIRSSSQNGDELSETWRDIYAYFRKLDLQTTKQFIEGLYGEGDIIVYTRETVPSYVESQRNRSEGNAGQKAVRHYHFGEDGGGDSGTYGRSGVNNDTKAKAPDDGAFFDDFVGNDGKSFSMKSTGEINLFDSMMGNDQQTEERLAVSESELARVKAENERLSDRIDALKEQFKVTKGYRPNEKALRRVANGVLKKASSKYDADTLTEDLRSLFDSIGNQDGFNGDSIMAAANAIARKVLEKSSKRDDTVYEATKDARDYFRRARLSLTDKQKAETESVYDSYNAYRRSLMGKLNLVNDGLPLDQAWGEISEMFPGYFDKNTPEGDQPAKVKEFLETAYARPYRNPYGTLYDMDDAAYELASALFDEYFNVPQVQTFADKQRSKLNEANRKYRECIEAERRAYEEQYQDALALSRGMREIELKNLAKQYSEAMDDQKAEYRQKYREMVRKKNRQLDEQNAAFQAQKKRRAETRENAKYRDRIRNNARELYAWLQAPNKKKHVPATLQNTVAKLLENLDIEYKRPSQNADAWRAAVNDDRFPAAPTLAQRFSLRAANAALLPGNGLSDQGRNPPCRASEAGRAIGSPAAAGCAVPIAAIFGLCAVRLQPCMCLGKTCLAWSRRRQSLQAGRPVCKR